MVYDDDWARAHKRNLLLCKKRFDLLVARRQSKAVLRWLTNIDPPSRGVERTCEECQASC